MAAILPRPQCIVMDEKGYIMIHFLSTRVVNSRHTLQWGYIGRNGVLNHRRLDCLPDRLFRRRSKKTSKLRVTGLCDRNSSVTGEFPVQRVSNAEMFPFDFVNM